MQRKILSSFFAGTMSVLLISGVVVFAIRVIAGQQQEGAELTMVLQNALLTTGLYVMAEGLLLSGFCTAAYIVVRKNVKTVIWAIENAKVNISADNIELDIGVDIRGGEFAGLSGSINRLLSRVRTKLIEIIAPAHERERLAAIVAIADAGIIIKDKEGLVLEWNIGAEDILGFKPEDMVGKTTHAYTPEEGHDEIDEVEQRLSRGEHIAHAEVVRKHKNGTLVDCSASYTPIFDNGEFSGSVAIFHDISDKKNLETAMKAAVRETEHKNRMIMDSLAYAGKIQKNMLPMDEQFKEAFSEHFVIWKPRDIVGGDIYWIKNFAEGSVLCVSDCTGHGTPGALLTMLVVSSLEAVVNEHNYTETSEIIWLLDRRLSSALNATADVSDTNKLSTIKDGCDIAVLYIGKDGIVRISAANLNVFICNGQEVERIKGQRLYIGEGRLQERGDIREITIPADSTNKYYVVTDGLFEQIGGGNGVPMGYTPFKEIILSSHGEASMLTISARILEALEAWQGEETRVDDVAVVAFIPKKCKNGGKI